MPSTNPIQIHGVSQNPKDLSPLVVIIGPTAVGKTEISIQLAESLGGEIVSADSRLFYRGMDIGTAKPTLSERQRVLHHLIDIVNPDQTLSLPQFQEKASAAIADIHTRGRLPFLVGGTGQYIRAVIQGWDPPRIPPHPGLRQALEGWADEIGKDALHARLRSLDLAAADQIDPRNLRRTVRALEVIFTSGRSFSQQRLRSLSPYNTLLLGLIRPREELYARIDSRLEEMLKLGFVAEVQSLLDRGYSPNLPALSAIGYPQIIAFLQGDINIDEAASQIKRLTRTFVRRQANWFKAQDPEIYWFEAAPGTGDQIKKMIIARFTEQ